MEVHALHVTLTEEDLNGMLAKELAKHKRLKNARLRVLPEGVKVNGVLHVLFDVGFESLWTFTVVEGKLQAKLAQLSAMGFSANMLKTTLLRFVAEAAQKTDGVQIQGDAVVVDVDRAVAHNGVRAKINLNAVITTEGVLIIEAGR